MHQWNHGLQAGGRMARAKVLIVAAGFWLAACGDGIGPPAGSVEPDRMLHHLRWSPDLGSPTFATVRGETRFEGFESPSQSSVAVLDTYQTGFWAQRGSDAGVEIRYLAADGTWRPYLRLTVPGEALDRRPDGSPLADGEPVWITVSVDPEQLVVQLEPTGLTFRESSPARLELWYTGADPDFDGNGTVDAADRYIALAQLAVWVQELPGTPWARVPAAHSPDHQLFSARLRHFSGYAVSH